MSSFKGGAHLPCCILDWVKKADSKFAAALQSLCLDELIGKSQMGRINAQQTFIMPSENIRQIFIKAATDPDLEKDWHDKFGSFIIPMGLPDARAFADAEHNSEGNGIGNLYGAKFTVAINGSSVVLNGVTITPAADFPNSSAFAVWEAKSKSDALVAKISEPKWRRGNVSRRRRGDRGEKQGGADSASAKAMREKVAAGSAMLRAKFLEGLAAGVAASPRPVVSVLDAYSTDPYLIYCIALFGELKSAGQLDTVRSRGLLDYSPLVTFELVARPGFASGEFDAAVVAAFEKCRAGATAATVADYISEVGTRGESLAGYIAARDAVDSVPCVRFVDLVREYGDAEALWADTVREAYGNYVYDLFRSVFGPSEVVDLPYAAAPRNTSYESFTRAFFVGSGLVRGDESAAVRRFVSSSDFHHTQLNATGARELMAKLAASDPDFIEGLAQEAGQWQRDIFAVWTLATLEPRLGAHASRALRAAADTIKHAHAAVRASHSKEGASAYGGGAASYFGGVEDIVAELSRLGGC
jgi:hypothetical protein